MTKNQPKEDGMKFIPCKGVGDNNGFYEMEVSKPKEPMTPEHKGWEEELWNTKDEYHYSLSDAVRGGDLHEIEYAKSLINPKVSKLIHQAEQRVAREMVDKLRALFLSDENLYGPNIKDLADEIKHHYNITP